ncbi:coumaroyl-CoA:anthocyanidin 3-O-glucoside-6''-O-coumaroyltransferase 1 isoform X2 [Medicago truncatula]|uniref:coumaroyl-CoA:anthocyanidin 3-O-glucoside-6''-O-coumaroyltransferase 1 isoform X2 n=1 Tax=Medicago truncatula TaxID=3880 RepID=UPI000D2F20EF|nr:coumaroyl-CoA:anthocyanidin 3-O-glucoside-6''-O-coumaroyltransferase 1 isoform X2 [Medicago truncatula]
MANHKLIEQTVVFPSTPRTTTTFLPLTFLDLPFAGPVYVERLFFYHFPHSTTHFSKTTLPSLKHSLSLTLQHFFPLAGNLHCPLPPHKPFILCTQNDSVTFTVIESSANFNHLSTNQHPKNLQDFNHLVPKLTEKTTFDDGNDIFIFPLLSLQVTVFPNHGLCIAIKYCHVMDDNCCNHLMKSWSFIHRKGDVVDFKSQPCFDRQVLRDPEGLEDLFLKGYYEKRKTWEDNRLIGKTQSIEKHDEDCVKAIIVFGKEEIEGMKKWVLNEWKKKDQEIQAPQFLSKYVVTCAFVWVSLVKAMHRSNHNIDEKDEYFCFTGDCRDRLGYTIPEGYFGNCLAFNHATMKRRDVKGEDGFVNAVKVIEKAITEMKNEPLKDATKWEGSAKKIVKVEMMHSLKCMSIAESGDREGGLEVGLAFKSEDYECFSSVIQQGLQALKF